MNTSDLAEIQMLLVRAAHKAAHQAARCDGKYKFESFGLATMAAKRTSRSKERRVVAYLCECCGAFHTGERSKFWKRKHV